ncbi:Translationally-controlled tumor protein-like protein [Bienertia sinuspersici]
MAVIVVYWYSVISVAIVVTAVVMSVYVLCRKETQNGAHEVKQSLYQSLLNTAIVNPNNNNDLHQLVQNDNVAGSCIDNDERICWPRSQQLWTSCWRGLHPGFLLGVRVVAFFVLAFFLSWDIHDWGPSIFIYYTEWTYSLVMMYFAIGSVVSAHGCWLYYTQNNTYLENVEESQVRDDLEENPTIINRVTGKQDINRLPIKLQRQYYQEQDAQRAGFWGYFMQISYQISAGAAILTDVIFWGIIVPFVSNAHLGLDVLMGCIHSVNIVFLLIETSINHLPFPCFRLAYFVLWSSAYVIVQWLINLCGFTWYLVLAAFHIACYGLYALIVKAKDTVFSKLFPHSYMRLCNTESHIKTVTVYIAAFNIPNNQ